MKKLMTLLAIGAIGASLSGCGRQIDAGHVGLRKNFGKIATEALEPGFYWYSPIGGDVVEINVQSQVRDGKEQSYTRDVQTGTFAYKVAYRANPADVPMLYTMVGADWENRLVMDLVPDTLKNVVGQWEATDLIANRSKVSPQVMEQLTARLAAKCKNLGLPADSVEVVSFALTNIDFTDEFEKAVEAKVTAIQKAEGEKNKTVQVQEQANQTIITAKANAEAMQIQSAALSANQNLTAYKAVEKWDGHLPSYMAANTPLPFLKIGDK